MRRRELLVLGTAALVPYRAIAQRTQSPRLGLLWIHDPGDTHYLTVLREGLSSQGYVDGKNIRIDERFLVDRYEALPAAAARLSEEKIDLIVTYGTTAAQAARKATSRIPIVMVASGDPVKSGVAASLARPGGNVTGFTSISQDLSAKRLQILREMLPSAKRIAVLLYPGSQSEAEALRNYEAVAPGLNMEVRAVEVRGPADIEPVIATLPGMKFDAILVVGSTLFIANRLRIAAAIAKTRIPAVYSNQSFAQVGGLAVFGADILNNFRRVVVYIDKILKGANPADLPIEQPTKVEFAINLKTARALGLKIPQPLLLRADRVIE